MGKTLRLTLALTAVALIATAAAAFAATNRTHASDTFVFGTEGDPVLLDGALDLGRPLRAGRRSDVRRTGRAEARHDEGHPAARDELVDLEERSLLDVQPPQGREVPRRDTVRRKGRLLQLQPLVQPARLPAGRVNELLLVHRLRRVREAGDREPGPGQEPVPRVQGRERVDRSGSSSTVRSSSFLAALVLPGVLDREPDRSRQVQGGCRHRGRRRLLPADRHVRHLDTRSGTGPFKFGSWRIGDKLVFMVRNDKLLGHQGEAEDADLPPDHRLDGAPAGAPVGRARRRQPARAAGRPGGCEQLEPEGAEPARVQHRVRRHEPEDRAAQQPQGASGGRLRARQEGRRSARSTVVVARSRTSSCRRLVEGYAKKGVPDYSVQPGQGQGAAPGGGPDPAGDAGVLVPDRPASWLHAGSAAELPGVRREPREVGLQDRRAPGSVAWRLPGGRPVGPGPALPARLDG